MNKIKIFALLLLTFMLFSLVFNRPVRATAKVPVLMYHYIGNNPNPSDKERTRLSVPPDKFTQQMDYLSKNGYNPITLYQLTASLRGQVQLPPKPVILTFDDGYVDLYYNAFPILKTYGFHAIAFIPTGLIDKYPGFHLTWSQIQDMNNSGLIEFEAHSVNHISLTNLNPGRLEQELANSKKALGEETGRNVQYLAYPNGKTNALVEAEARKLGYIAGFGTRYGKVGGLSMNMPRERITGSMSLQSFATRL
jgi:peptidoglycan/xylan/chitin deacetylase (PgdA/CDA1 family)